MGSIGILDIEKMFSDDVKLVGNSNEYGVLKLLIESLSEDEDVFVPDQLASNADPQSVADDPFLELVDGLNALFLKHGLGASPDELVR